MKTSVVVFLSVAAVSDMDFLKKKTFLIAHLQIKKEPTSYQSIKNIPVPVRKNYDEWVSESVNT